MHSRMDYCWAVVVAQLADRSLLTQEVRGSNRVTVEKCYAEHVFAVYF